MAIYDSIEHKYMFYFDQNVILGLAIATWAVWYVRGYLIEFVETLIVVAHMQNLAETNMFASIGQK